MRKPRVESHEVQTLVEDSFGLLKAGDKFKLPGHTGPVEVVLMKIKSTFDISPAGSAVVVVGPRRMYSVHLGDTSGHPHCQGDVRNFEGRETVLRIKTVYA